MAHYEHPDEIIKGIELIFIELKKFKAQNFREETFPGPKIKYLWLKFLTDINEKTKEVPKELLGDEAIKQALDILHVSAFTKEELDYYDKYWDRVRVERTILQEAYEKGKKFNIQKLKNALKELEKERRAKEKERRAKEEKEKQLEKERAEKIRLQYETAKALKNTGISIEKIIQITGLTEKDIEKL